MGSLWWFIIHSGNLFLIIRPVVNFGPYSISLHKLCRYFLLFRFLLAFSLILHPVSCLAHLFFNKCSHFQLPGVSLWSCYTFIVFFFLSFGFYFPSSWDFVSTCDHFPSFKLFCVSMQLLIIIVALLITAFCNSFTRSWLSSYQLIKLFGVFCRQQMLQCVFELLRGALTCSVWVSLKRFELFQHKHPVSGFNFTLSVIF